MGRLWIEKHQILPKSKQLATHEVCETHSHKSASSVVFHLFHFFRIIRIA